MTSKFQPRDEDMFPESDVEGHLECAPPRR